MQPLSQAEFISICHEILSPFVGKNISNKTSMLFFLQRWRLTLSTKYCYFKGCQKHCGSDKGKAECEISVLVPAVLNFFTVCVKNHPKVTSSFLPSSKVTSSFSSGAGTGCLLEALHMYMGQCPALQALEVFISIYIEQITLFTLFTF